MLRPAPINKTAANTSLKLAGSGADTLPKLRSVTATALLETVKYEMSACA